MEGNTALKTKPKTPEVLTEEAWLERVHALARARDWTGFEIGDLLLDAKKHLDGGRDDQRRYNVAAHLFKLGYGRLRNLAVVANAFPVSRRRYNVPVAHYSVVASLDEKKQDDLLAQAEEHGWSEIELREAKRKAVGGKPRQEANVDPKDRVVVLVPRGRYAAFIDAAGARGKSEPEMKKAVADWLLALGEKEVAQ